MTGSDHIKTQVAQATSYLQERIGAASQIAMILGSGFASVGSMMEDPLVIPYAEIPAFPVTAVKGHAGELLAGTIAGVRVLIMKGRFHYYEGHAMQVISIPIRVLKHLGIDTLILTNAAGSINRAFHPGDLMVIEDHLNLTFRNPLAGQDNTEYGPRFPDTSHTYNKDLIDLAHTLASDQGLSFRQGVYAFTSGPTYETPAEIVMMGRLGADAVGMSTFPEALVATQAGVKVFGLSMISNYGSGLSETPLDHDEVMETMAKIRKQVHEFFYHFIKNIPHISQQQ